MKRAARNKGLLHGLRIAFAILAVWPSALFGFLIQIGDERQTVIETYGFPKSRAQLGDREIFNYSEGGVVLQDGRVSEIRFSKGEPKSLRKPTPRPTLTPTRAQVASPRIMIMPAVPKAEIPLPESTSPTSLVRMFAPFLWLVGGALALGFVSLVLTLRKKRGPVADSRKPPRVVNPLPREPPPNFKITRPAPIAITRLTRSDLDRLEWRRFEELVQGYFEATGWTARRSSVGADGGIDIYLSQDLPEKRTACVQCKQRSNAFIGVSIVRELYGVMAADGIPHGYVVTTHEFSSESRAFAAGKPLTLISGDELLGLFAKLTEADHSRVAGHAFRDDFETPTCPSCDVKTVLRNSAKPFWGCRNYPRCKYKMECWKA